MGGWPGGWGGRKAGCCPPPPPPPTPPPGMLAGVKTVAGAEGGGGRGCCCCLSAAGLKTLGLWGGGGWKAEGMDAGVPPTTPTAGVGGWVGVGTCRVCGCG